MIGPSDRVLVCGMSGSGKSRLTTRIASRWDRVLVVDLKFADPEATITNAVECYRFEDALRALPGRVVYRVPRSEKKMIGRNFARLTDKLWRLGGRHAVAVHEIVDLCETAEGRAALEELYREGRFAFMPVVGDSQRPVDIPKVVRTEASHIFCFALVDPVDRDTMAGYMGPAVRERPLPLPFDFTCWHRGPNGTLELVPAIA